MEKFTRRQVLKSGLVSILGATLPIHLFTLNIACTQAPQQYTLEQAAQGIDTDNDGQKDFYLLRQNEKTIGYATLQINGEWQYETSFGIIKLPEDSAEEVRKIYNNVENHNLIFEEDTLNRSRNGNQLLHSADTNLETRVVLYKEGQRIIYKPEFDEGKPNFEELKRERYKEPPLKKRFPINKNFSEIKTIFGSESLSF